MDCYFCKHFVIRMLAAVKAYGLDTLPEHTQLVEATEDSIQHGNILMN